MLYVVAEARSTVFFFWTKLALFIFDTVSSNKFYNEIYADLYKEIVKKYPIFVDILNSIVIDFYFTIT